MVSQLPMYERKIPHLSGKRPGYHTGICGIHKYFNFINEYPGKSFGRFKVVCDFIEMVEIKIYFDGLFKIMVVLFIKFIKGLCNLL